MYTIFFNKINTTALRLETSGPYDAVQSGLYVSPIGHRQDQFFNELVNVADPINLDTMALNYLVD
jgi:hypothetical protein